MTKWAYLLVYSDSCGSWEHIKKFLNSKSTIHNWYRITDNSVFIVSSNAAKSLGENFHNHALDKTYGLFFVIDVAGDSFGMLPKECWDMIYQKN